MRRATRGFSFAELMAVVAIATIMLTIAVPDLLLLVRQQQLKATVNDLFSAIDMTRAQAIARGSRVELVPADAEGIDWSRGWIIFVDADGNRRPGGGDEIIAVHGPIGTGIRFDTNFSGKDASYYVAYNGAGRSCTDASSMAAHWGTISLFHGKQTRRIKINMLGRARVCDPARDGATCSGAPDAP